MIVEHKLSDVNPRTDFDYVIAEVKKWLDNCDPSDRIDITFNYPTR